MSEVTELTNEQRVWPVLETVLRNDVKESDGAHWEYPESELQALLDALVPKVATFVEAELLRRLSTQGAGPQCIPLTKGQFAIVDAADFKQLSQWKWHAWFNKTGNTWYARRSVTNGGKRVILMHRQIIEAETGTLVDHCDHNGLNNCRSNLRKATRAQNQHNRDVQRNNACGFKGVSWSKRRKMWIAQIEVNGHKIPLGYFANKDDAAKAYTDKAEEMHGEFFRAPSDPPRQQRTVPCPICEMDCTGPTELAAKLNAAEHCADPHEHGREVKR